MKKIMIATVILILLVVGVFTVSRAQNQWEWIDTGYDFILYDISFPQGQSQIGYAVGSNSTYNGDGIILKTTDGGDTWSQISQGTIPGLEAVFFTDIMTGYAGGWQNYFIKTTDGGQTWSEIMTEPTPVISVFPQELFFPQTLVGEVFEIPVTIHNSGGEILEVSNIWSDVSVFYPSQTSASIVPGDSVTLSVIFEPDGAGNFTGILSVESNDPLNPLVEVDLNGEGIQPLPVISVVDEIIFDTTVVNSTTFDTTSLYNIGNATLDVSSILTSNSVFTVNVSSFSLEPGESQELIIGFTPDIQGDFIESMEIFNNSLNNPVLISLEGYGILETDINSKVPAINLTASPNPFENYVIISTNEAFETPAPLLIYNLNGELIIELKPEINHQGYLVYKWIGNNTNSSVVPKGLYFGVVEGKISRQIIKLIKI